MTSIPPRPPETRRESLEELLHGTRVEDPYRWLESGGSPEVRAWTEAQSRHARSILDALPGRSATRARLEDLFAIGSLSPPTPRGDRLFFTQRTGDQEQPVLKLTDAATGDERTLIDPTEHGDETRALDWYYPSPDGTLVAFGLSREGSEQSTLSVMDVGGGDLLDDEIPFTRACSLAWLPDTTGFFYTRYPEPGSVTTGEEAYHRQVFEHRLGDAWRDDRYVFGRDRPLEDWPNIQLSPGGRWLVATVSRGWSRTDVYLHDREGGSGFYPVVEGIEALFGVTPRDDRLLIHTNLDAPHYRLMAADPDALDLERWKTLIPEGRDVLEVTAQVGDSLLALWLRDASSRLTLHDADGREQRVLPMPDLGSIASLTGEWNGSVAFFDFSSYATPTSIHRIDLRSHETTPWRCLEAPFDPGEFRVRLTHYSSKDGTRISMFLVDRKDRPEDATGPAVLNGYGGFNVSLTPSFGRSLVHWLERGGLFAVPHLRGGGEYGEEWHQAGMLDRKQNVFDDFLAAGEALVSQGLVAADRLAIMGGSNGGLLVGAALTQRPELFRAVVCQVPLLDMVRYHRFRIARLWIPEYGTADDEAAFRWLYDYSPYHRVVDGTSYPAVLITTGESDSRVDPMHARKMAARLQAATSSGRAVLLRSESRAGHGQGKPISRVLEEWTDVWAFLADSTAPLPPIRPPPLV